MCVFTCSILASIMTIQLLQNLQVHVLWQYSRILHLQVTTFFKYWLNTREYYHNTYKYCHNTCEYWVGEYTPNVLFLLQKRYQKLTTSFWSVCPKREMKSPLSFTFSVFSPFAFWFCVFAKKSFEHIFVEHLSFNGLSARFTLHIKMSFEWCSLGSYFW